MISTLRGLARSETGMPQGEHAGLVLRLDAVGIERVAEEQLAAERALRASAPPSRRRCLGRARTACTVSTFCSTVRSIVGSTPGRSNWTRKVSSFR